MIGPVKNQNYKYSKPQQPKLLNNLALELTLTVRSTNSLCEKPAPSEHSIEFQSIKKETKDLTKLEEPKKLNKTQKKSSILLSILKINEDPIEVLFPIVKIKDFPKEKKYKRLFNMFMIIFIFSFISSMKYFLQKQMKKAFSCDISVDWKLYSKGINDKTIIPLEETGESCEEFCDFDGFLISKFMAFNFYGIFMIDTYLTIYSYFGAKEANRSKLSFLLVFLVIIGYLVGDAVFFTSKAWAQNFAGIFSGLFYILYIFKGKAYFIMILPRILFLAYFFPTIFFFEIFWPQLYQQNPDIWNKILAILAFFLQVIYLKILGYSHFSRHKPGNKLMILCPLYTFEFLKTGLLHKLIQNNGFSMAIIENMLITLFLDLDRKLVLTKTLRLKLKKYCGYAKKDEEIKLNDYELIMINYKSEIEIVSHCIYGIVLLIKYMDGCAFNICDCFGMPLTNMITIKTEHFILFGSMMAFSVFQWSIRWIILRTGILKKYGHYPKLEGISLIYYYSLSYGSIIHFGIGAMYSMMT